MLERPHGLAVECECGSRAGAFIGSAEARSIQSASRRWRQTRRHKPFLRMGRGVRPARLASQG